MVGELASLGLETKFRCRKALRVSNARHRVGRIALMPNRLSADVYSAQIVHSAPLPDIVSTYRVDKFLGKCTPTKRTRVKPCHPIGDRSYCTQVVTCSRTSNSPIVRYHLSHGPQSLQNS